MLPDDSDDTAVLRALSQGATHLDLSARQLELLARLARGLSRAEVAAEMGITVAAVDYHGRVIRKSSGLRPRDLVLRLLRDAIVAYEFSPSPSPARPTRTKELSSCDGWHGENGAT